LNDDLLNGVTMSSQKIRNALGLLQDDADNETAWLELQDAITAPDVGMSNDELVDLLGAARREHETRREWHAVANLLEYEISLSGGSPQEAARQAELARVLEDELFEDARALAAYKRLLELRPEDPTATEAIERAQEQRLAWKELTQRKLEEVPSVEDPSIRSSMLSWVVETSFRHGRDEVSASELIDLLEQAVALDPRNRRACLLLERFYREGEQWEDACRVLEILAMESTVREERFAAWLRLARLVVRKLENERRGVAAYERALDLSPGYPEAMNFLSDFFGRSEQWDHLVALYEDQLRSGGFRSGQDLGIWLQIAMVQWRMRERPDLAEPYFDKVRRAEPAHPGMLSFYRDWCEEHDDSGKLLTILTDAQRSLPDGEQKAQLGAEIAQLAENQEDVHKAIEQYKSLVRQDPGNTDARSALKRLYRQTSAWTSLVDVLRHELDNTSLEDPQGRLVVLREIAEVYRDNIKSDSALVTVLGQILQLDDSDVDAVRELCRVYEALQRWRDLLVHQQKLAELSEDKDEKLSLLRAAGKRWMEQFQNVQNATDVYERIFAVEPTDEEARQRLRELYQRRRAWPQLFALLEKESEFVEGQDKVALLFEMAKLAAERLDRASDSIALYKKVLEIDPEAPGVMDALEKQAERDKDFETVAQVLERRVEMADDENARINVLQKLGGVYADRLSDPRRAASAWRRVLDIRPDHARAMRVLRDSYLAAEDYDAITELYGQNEDWEGLAEVLSSAADRVTSTEAKVDLSFRSAEVYENKLNVPERSFRAYERVLSVQPTDLRAASALIPIYENDERWSRLPALYETLLAQSEDPDEQLDLLRKLADVTGNRLSDKEAALSYARRAYDLAPNADGALELLEAHARTASSWEPFVEALENRIAGDPDMPSEEQRALKLRLANVYASDLGRTDDAIKTYRALVAEEPTDAEVMRTLDRILRAASRHDDLRWLFELRIEQADESSAVEMLTEWATLEEDAFNSPERAIELYRRALRLDASNEQALASLPRLLLGAGDASAAAEVVEAHRDQAEGLARGELELTLAELFVGQLQRPQEALGACERALALGSDHPRVVAVLDRLVAIEETRSRAAAVLVDVHANLGDPRQEAAALAVLIDSTVESGARLDLLAKLIDVQELKLNEPGMALDVVLKAVTEFPEELVLWDRAKDLSIVAGRPGELATAYQGVLEGESSLPDVVEVELCQRAAKLCREQVGDQDAAIPYLERVLARQPANEEAFKDLKEILMARERWSDLESLYARAITGTTDSARRIEFLAEVALICEDIIEDAAKSIDYYERILDIDSLHGSATMALEKLYASEKKYEKLVSLLERRLDRADEEELVAIKLRLGQLHLDNLRDATSALPHVEDVLRMSPNAHDARGLAERILEVPELRARAARVLEDVYAARDETRDLVRVLDIRLEVTSDEAESRELLRRIATLRDERLADDQGALDALAKLVPLDPVDNRARARLMDIGRRAGAHERIAAVLTQAADLALTSDVRGAILMEVASIYRDHLSDAMRAEAVYRRVLEIDPSDPNLVLPAARALEEIYAGVGNHGALVEVLRTEVKLEDDVQRRAEIHGRLGEICESILEDLPGAISAWRARLEDDPVDTTALAALERLYEKVEAWRDLVEVLRTRQDSAEDEGDRRRLMTRMAVTLTDKLQDVAEATLAWRAIVDEFGPDRSTLEFLEALYAKAERWIDLAETLEIHLGLAEEPEARLALLVRLGDVRRAHLSDLGGALDAYRQALTVEPSHQASREALERLLDEETARREAAQVLHPLYEADADNEKLLRVVEIEADTSMMPDERLSLLQQAVRVAEGPLGDASRAFDFAVRGLKEAAGGDDVSSWLETVERLSAATRRFGELVTLLRGVVPDILDGQVQLDVTLRIADLARTELADRELARDYYIQALDIRGDDRRALIALESLYEEAGDATALLDIIRRRVDVAEGDEERKQLLFRQARLCSDVLEDDDGAIGVYETVLDIDLDPAAVEALEKLYMGADRPSDLIALYERQLEAEPENKAELRVKIARVADGNLNDSMRAFEELGEALSEDAQNEAAIGELERLLEEAKDPEHRARAAEMLEPFYLGRADWKRVKVTIAARLDSSQDPDKRRELLRRLALLQEEQEEDFAAALETTAKLLHEDITDQDTWRQLESQARVASAEKRLAEIFAAELDEIMTDEEATAKLARRTGEIFASLGDIQKALVYYRRALAFEPESTELFEAIDKLLIQAGRSRDRVELYRGALDHRFEPKDRLDILHTIADLERKALEDPDKAIDTYCAALDVDETDEVALDALTELYRDRERFSDLAELFLRRAENEADTELSCTHRLALARLQRDEMKDVDAAIDQLEEIVRQVPTNKAAMAELEGLLAVPDHKARVVDILLPMYEGADDWRKLIYLNAQRFDLASDDLDRVAILRETARLWEQRGSDSNRAFDAYRAAFEIDAEELGTRQDLERLAEALGAWDELAEAYEKGVEGAEGTAKRELLAALAAIHDEKRDDPRQALEAYGRLHRLDETDPEPLEKMDFLAMLLSDWEALVGVLVKKAELVGGDEDRASAWRRVGECKRDMLEDKPGAIEAFEHALELDPVSPWTIDNLIDLYEGRDDGQRLVELYQRRVELAEGDEEELKYEMLVKAADRYQQHIRDNQAAIDVLRQALDVRAADEAVLSKLEALFRAEEMWPDLLETLRLEASVAKSTEDRVKLRREIGKLLAKEIAEPAEALDAFRMVLDEAPEDGESIDAVREIGQNFEELRLEAADVLEPVLRSTGRHDKLVAALEMRLLAQHEGVDRALTLRAMANVLNESLSDQGKALDALIRALSETPDDMGLHEDIQHLAGSCDGWGKYASALEERAGKIFEAALATDLWTRLGRICETKLSDDKRAVEAFTRALEQSGDSVELLTSLDRLHSKLDNQQQLSEVLERRVTLETDPSSQADIYHRLAVLQIESFGDKLQGLETLRMALDHAPDHEKACESLEKLTEDRDLFEEAASALETVYRARGDYGRLADLYEKRVSFAQAPMDRLRLRLDLARVLEEQASDPRRAQRIIEAALSDDVGDGEVLGKLADLADANQQWTEAAKAFSAALDKADGLDGMTARDLYMRLADWYRMKLADTTAAEAATGQALKRDPDNIDLLRAIEDLQREPGRERDLIATLRRRALLDLDTEKRRELFREANTLARAVVADLALSEEVLRQLIELDEGYLWAYEELTQLREQARDHREVVELLLRQAELTASGPDSLRLRHEAAEVLREKLDESERALGIYEEIFDADPMDVRAAAALRDLYAKQERYKDLSDLLGRLIDVSTDKPERNKLRLELAELYAGRFDQLDDAVFVLLRVLEDEPGQTDGVVLLSQLYEKSGRVQDLADLLNTQIDLAKERGDADAELTFTVRLGEVYESRLEDKAKAIRTYEAVLERDGSHKGALEALGRLFESKGEKEKAAETLEKLLGLLEGEEAVALSLRLAGIFEATKDDVGARRVLERGLTVQRDSTDVRETLRRLYERTEAWAEVAEMLAEDADRAQDVPQKVKLLQQAAEVHMTKRQDAGAAAVLLDKASELAPEDRDLLLSLCDAYSASGRGKDAIAALKKIVESYGGKRVKELAAIHHRLANAYVSEGDKEQGLAELDQAFRINPGNLAILVDLGRLALDVNDLERAQKTFRALLLQRLDVKAPITKAEVFFYLGDISNRQGEKQKAIQMLERAVENDPNLDKAKNMLATLKA
jgi:tetratricopeptide (TPR) repeat protein